MRLAALQWLASSSNVTTVLDYSAAQFLKAGVMTPTLQHFSELCLSSAMPRALWLLSTCQLSFILRANIRCRALLLGPWKCNCKKSGQKRRKKMRSNTKSDMINADRWNTGEMLYHSFLFKHLELKIKVIASTFTFKYYLSNGMYLQVPMLIFIPSPDIRKEILEEG